VHPGLWRRRAESAGRDLRPEHRRGLSRPVPRRLHLRHGARVPDARPVGGHSRGVGHGGDVGPRPRHDSGRRPESVRDHVPQVRPHRRAVGGRVGGPDAQLHQRIPRRRLGLPRRQLGVDRR
jgi:hypothetical protein